MRHRLPLPLLALVVPCVAVAEPVPFANPPQISSSGGVLEATLVIAPATVTVAGKAVTLDLYNGLYMPPVLRLQPGDRVKLRLQNGGPDDANVHYHGFQVTPRAPGDDVFLTVPTGGTHDYDFALPAGHPEGLYWYHPHVHPGVNRDIAGGLSGAIVVGDLAGSLGLKGVTEQVLLLKDLKLKKGQPVPDPDPAGPTKRTVNGLFKPRMTIAPGEMQLWRIGNIGANVYYKLKLEGFKFFVVAQDGNVKNQIVETSGLLMPPASRYEVLVVAPAKKGVHKLQALKFKTGPDGDGYPAQTLASVKVEGDPVATPPFPAMPVIQDLRDVTITGTRTVTFADDPDDPNQFFIDDKVYEHDRIDQTVALGSIEEWTIVNTAKELHAFHIHQTDFQVVSVNGEERTFTGYQDTVNLPAATKKGGPSVTVVRIPFTNPLMVGKFVYHCHIVQHADQGMMANIEVVAP